MIDPITLTVIQNRLQQVCEEMDIILDRAAFSPIISEGQDRASGIFTFDHGLLIAQGSSGMPIHIGAMQFAAGTIAKRADIFEDGDIFIINDPYLGGTHLMDVKLIMPVFIDGDLFCLLGSSGHWPDIGGSVPGGFVTRAEEVQQEGLRISGVRIYKKGQLDDDLLNLILSNVRIPDQRLGDLQAQVSSLRAGQQALKKVVAEYGSTLMLKGINHLLTQSAKLMRQRISEIKPGTYRFEDAMDNDGIEAKPLWIRLDLTVKKDKLILDFSRSSGFCSGPLNSVISATTAAVFVALKHIYPNIPTNAGCFEPIEIIAPDTIFLNASYPRPTSGCASEVSQRVVDVVFGAMAQAIPERLHGAPMGTSLNLTIGGYDPVGKYRYVFYFYSGGGAGGWLGGDGISNACTTVGLAKTPPIEVCEQQMPVLFEEYALRHDSCGAGQWRGGLGVRYRIRLLRGEAKLSLLGDRATRGPFGVQGGGSAAKTDVKLRLKGKAYVPPLITKDEQIKFCEGDTFQAFTPGGGGYGKVKDRDPMKIKEDIKREYITRAYAITEFGFKNPTLLKKKNATSSRVGKAQSLGTRKK